MDAFNIDLDRDDWPTAHFATAEGFAVSGIDLDDGSVAFDVATDATNPGSGRYPAFAGR